MAEQLASLDPERQAKAREYARIRRRWWAADQVVGLVYLALWVGLGWGVMLRQRIDLLSSPGAPLTGIPWWVRLLLMALALVLPLFLVAIPLSFHTGFTLPHRFGLSTQTVRSWLDDLWKGIAISAATGAPLLVGLYFLIRTQPGIWWLWAAAAYSLVTVVLIALAPLILMPIFSKVTPLGEEHADLRDRLMRLARSAGTRVRGVFRLDMSRRTRTANAGVAGLGPTWRIVLGDTLLAEFTADEIETILAHELGHHVHHDIPTGIGIVSALNFAAFFLAFYGLRWIVVTFGLSGLDDPAGLPAIALLSELYGLVVMPLANAYSRWRERRADRYCLQATQKPEAFASAMIRLANQNLAEVDPEAWVVFFLYSHPPLRERLSLAEAYASAMGSTIHQSEIGPTLHG